MKERAQNLRRKQMEYVATIASYIAVDLHGRGLLPSFEDKEWIDFFFHRKKKTMDILCWRCQMYTKM